jgi:hypothetical protein
MIDPSRLEKLFGDPWGLETHALPKCWQDD